MGGWLSGLGVIHTALVYALIYHALPKLKSSAIGILTFIYPASAIFFRFRCERQVTIARAVSWARHHRSFECRDHTRMGAAEVFRCSGKALEFGDGHARR
jgi:hypothetical protein